MPVIVELHEDCYWCQHPMLSVDTSSEVTEFETNCGEVVQREEYKTCIVRCEHEPVCKIIEEKEKQ